MFKKIIVIPFLLSLSSCISFDLDNVVSDTVEATKSIYREIKRSGAGEVEREFSHQTDSNLAKTDSENIVACHQKLKEIVTVSGLSIKEVISESSEITHAMGKKVKCSMVAIVTATD